ncbi:Lrp/AsnC family transcriptional regulator [Mycolicibacterium sphagni]|uniref:Lrp/AsnC family transcriptional regulator n=1 Tax=Mycolicibacterium sphagni TaxID=1786 RepID=UPI0021F366E2|nr:Lrp/AsnC family transcriptional regulator [Mycolicibacterium sphagni]MCV7177064.1 Lrp/AsnC family transcriptional regulator [Mycolicibacterium sphagni]
MTNTQRVVDVVDAQILAALSADPRSTVVSLALSTGLSRNTVHARLQRLESDGTLLPFERRIEPARLGFPLTAFIEASVVQQRLTDIATTLEKIPQVLAVHGLSGVCDLLIHVVARDADDLYRMAGQILDIEGIEKTTTALVMRQLVDYRLAPLLDRITDADG